MKKKVDTEIKVTPIVEKAVKILYGQAVHNIKILEFEQLPLFRKPKHSWLVNVDFNDDQYEYSVQMDVQMSDGQITRVHELHRVPVKKQVAQQTVRKK